MVAVSRSRDSSRIEGSLVEDSEAAGAAETSVADPESEPVSGEVVIDQEGDYREE